MKDVFIVDGLRTPIGGMNKSLKNVPAVKLGAVVIKELLSRSSLNGNLVDEVIMGNAVGAGLGQNPARQSLILAGIPANVPAFTVNKVCASGLKAVMLAAQAASCGDADIIVAGGMESASQCPRLETKDNNPVEAKNENRRNTLINDGLWCNLVDAHMGTVAERTAKEFNISRDEQDRYALNSHLKACLAQEAGAFQREIVAVETADGLFSIDEKPRKNTSMEKLSRIPPAFEPGGTVTAGNSPQPADGAAAFIIASKEGLEKMGKKARAKILGYASVAVEPSQVFASAAVAIKECLKRCALTFSEIDLFEINEAFAVQSILMQRSTGLDPERMNVFGGTIALGHPLGASGARGLVTLMNALQTRKKEIGMTSVCMGGGCASALAIRIVNG